MELDIQQARTILNIKADASRREIGAQRKSLLKSSSPEHQAVVERAVAIVLQHNKYIASKQQHGPLQAYVARLQRQQQQQQQQQHKYHCDVEHSADAYTSDGPATIPSTDSASQEEMFDRPTYMESLFQAIREGRGEEVGTLTKGIRPEDLADPRDDHGATLLHACITPSLVTERTEISQQRLTFAAKLLRMETESNLRVFDVINNQDNSGRGLIHAIAQACDVAYMKLLLDHKDRHPDFLFDINAVSGRDLTALHYASAAAGPAMVALLLESDAKITSMGGKTPLEVVQACLEADVNDEDDSGDVNRRSKLQEVSALLTATAAARRLTAWQRNEEARERQHEPTDEAPAKNVEEERREAERRRQKQRRRQDMERALAEKEQKSQELTAKAKAQKRSRGRNYASRHAEPEHVPGPSSQSSSSQSRTSTPAPQSPASTYRPAQQQPSQPQQQQHQQPAQQQQQPVSPSAHSSAGTSYPATSPRLPQETQTLDESAPPPACPVQQMGHPPPPLEEEGSEGHCCRDPISPHEHDIEEAIHQAPNPTQEQQQQQQQPSVPVSHPPSNPCPLQQQQYAEAPPQSQQSDCRPYSEHAYQHAHAHHAQPLSQPPAVSNAQLYQPPASVPAQYQAYPSQFQTTNPEHARIARRPDAPSFEVPETSLEPTVLQSQHHQQQLHYLQQHQLQHQSQQQQQAYQHSSPYAVPYHSQHRTYLPPTTPERRPQVSYPQLAVPTTHRERERNRRQNRYAEQLARLQGVHNDSRSHVDDRLTEVRGQELQKLLAAAERREQVLQSVQAAGLENRLQYAYPLPAMSALQPAKPHVESNRVEDVKHAVGQTDGQDDVTWQSKRAELEQRLLIARQLVENACRDLHAHEHKRDVTQTAALQARRAYSDGMLGQAAMARNADTRLLHKVASPIDPAHYARSSAATMETTFQLRSEKHLQFQPQPQSQPQQPQPSDYVSQALVNRLTPENARSYYCSEESRARQVAASTQQSNYSGYRANHSQALSGSPTCPTLAIPSYSDSSLPSVLPPPNHPPIYPPQSGHTDQLYNPHRDQHSSPSLIPFAVRAPANSLPVPAAASTLQVATGSTQPAAFSASIGRQSSNRTGAETYRANSSVLNARHEQPSHERHVPDVERGQELRRPMPQALEGQRVPQPTQQPPQAPLHIPKSTLQPQSDASSAKLPPPPPSAPPSEKQSLTSPPTSFDKLRCMSPPPDFSVPAESMPGHISSTEKPFHTPQPSHSPVMSGAKHTSEAESSISSVSQPSHDSCKVAISPPSLRSTIPRVAPENRRRDSEDKYSQSGTHKTEQSDFKTSESRQELKQRRARAQALVEVEAGAQPSSHQHKGDINSALISPKSKAFFSEAPQAQQKQGRQDMQKQESAKSAGSPQPNLEGDSTPRAYADLNGHGEPQSAPQIQPHTSDGRSTGKSKASKSTKGLSSISLQMSPRERETNLASADAEGKPSRANVRRDVGQLKRKESQQHQARQARQQDRQRSALAPISPDPIEGVPREEQAQKTPDGGGRKGRKEGFEPLMQQQVRKERSGQGGDRGRHVESEEFHLRVRKSQENGKGQESCSVDQKQDRCKSRSDSETPSEHKATERKVSHDKDLQRAEGGVRQPQQKQQQHRQGRNHSKVQGTVEPQRQGEGSQYRQDVTGTVSGEQYRDATSKPEGRQEKRDYNGSSSEQRQRRENLSKANGRPVGQGDAASSTTSEKSLENASTGERKERNVPRSYTVSAPSAPQLPRSRNWGDKPLLPRRCRYFGIGRGCDQGMDCPFRHDLEADVSIEGR